MKQNGAHLSKRFYWLVFLAVVIAAAAASGDACADSFDAGRFMLDLPDGYRLAPQASEFVFNFDGPGPRMTAVFYAEQTDLRQGFMEFTKLVGDSFVEFKPHGDIQEMEVNGHPAAMGIYIGKVQVPKVGMVSLYNLVGAVHLENLGCLSFFASYAETQRNEWEDRVREAFFSIRAVGEPVTGSKNSRAISP